MDWIIKHHTAVLIWILSVSLYATGTMCYHSPALGVLLKIGALVAIIAGIREAAYDYED